MSALALAPDAGKTQVLATGDSRTVTEPTFPPVCTTLTSQMAIVSGGPASETAFDTSRLQTALTACPSGSAVELGGSGGNYAFLLQPITLPSGVGLIVDGGVTVFASRNPADYQSSSKEPCGTYGALGNGCTNLINLPNKTSGSGVYGYGVINARGGWTMLGTGTTAGESWWTNVINAGTAGLYQDVFSILKPTAANNFTLYKITLRDSPGGHLGWSGTGLTVWGVKIATPYTTHNTDGIDPVGTNITITNSSISDGDDNIAVGAESASANVTVSNVNTYSGHGISVGSYTAAGLTNFLVTNVNMAGTAADGVATGIRLKSAADRGGVLNTITYENICAKDMHYPLQLNPFYNTNAGTEIPLFENIVLKNVHFLTPTNTQNSYVVEFSGHDANHLTTLTMDNVVFDQLLAKNMTPAPAYTTITLEGNVYPAFLQSLTGTGVSYNGSATATASGGVSACPLSVFPYIVGELYLSTSIATSLQAATIAPTGSVTLNAMVEPAMSQATFGAWTGAAAPTASVNFYEGTVLKGGAALGVNGTLAALTLNNLTLGTHTYTAQYPGDANYNALTFGSVVVTVTGPTVATTTMLTAPSTAVYGTPVTLSATVSGAGGTPSGTVTFYDGTTAVTGGTSVAMSAGTAPVLVTLTGGAHSLTAVYSGDGTFITSTSAASTLTVTTAATSTKLTATPTSVTVGNAATLTATVTGVSGAATPTGTVVFSDGSTNLGSAPLSAGVAVLAPLLPNIGSRAITATYSGDANYAASSGIASETVTAMATSVTLTMSASTAYLGSTITLTAALVPAQTGASINFLSGSTATGAAATNASGVATYAFAPGAVGTYSLSASYTATGNYGGSQSAAQVLTVVDPVVLTATPNPIAIAPGASGTVTVGVASAGGFTGAVTLSCSSPVVYVTCTPTSSLLTLGGTPVSVTQTIAVAATTALLRDHLHDETTLAMFLPLGLLGLMLTSRRCAGLAVRGLGCLLLAAGLMGGLTGCGSSSSGTGTKGTVPSGSQVLTVTSLAAGVSQTVQITVNIP